MTDEPTKQVTLADGVELTSSVYHSNRTDVSYFVNAGGVLFQTAHGRRRVALVPVPVGEAVLAVKQATTQEDRVAAAEGLLHALGIDLVALIHKDSIDHHTDTDTDTDTSAGNPPAGRAGDDDG